MENKKIEDFTDLELGEAQGQLFNQLMQVQANLQMIQSEIQKRKPKEKEGKNEKS